MATREEVINDYEKAFRNSISDVADLFEKRISMIPKKLDNETVLSVIGEEIDMMIEGYYRKEEKHK